MHQPRDALASGANIVIIGRLCVKSSAIRMARSSADESHESCPSNSNHEASRAAYVTQLRIDEIDSQIPSIAALSLLRSGSCANAMHRN
jgi:hypothetical protein